jgi:hypothetical protein
MLIMICDNCGLRVEMDRALFGVDGGWTSIEMGQRTLDLCPDCSKIVK